MPESTLKETYPDRDLKFIRVVNIVASSFFIQKFNTEKLKRCEGSSYEPELFPPIYNKFNNVTLMYFHTGSIVIVGAKQNSEIDSAIAQFMSRVKQSTSNK
jgi:TATA-box binding protein (TBP) (component of TFIID and TFIIIB)